MDNALQCITELVGVVTLRHRSAAAALQDGHE